MNHHSDSGDGKSIDSGNTHDDYTVHEWNELARGRNRQLMNMTNGLTIRRR